jgi:hypothetical protein
MTSAASAAAGAAVLEADGAVVFDVEASLALAFECVALAVLSTPPWPLQAPWPPLLVVPSLQMTSAAAGLAGAAALEAVASLLVDFDFELVVAFSAGCAAAFEALLSTPPWPLQAPFPPWLVVPSLHVTSAASWACTRRGPRNASPISSSDPRLHPFMRVTS